MFSKSLLIKRRKRKKRKNIKTVKFTIKDHMKLKGIKKLFLDKHIKKNKKEVMNMEIHN